MRDALITQLCNRIFTEAKQRWSLKYAKLSVYFRLDTQISSVKLILYVCQKSALRGTYL